MEHLSLLSFVLSCFVIVIILYKLLYKKSQIEQKRIKKQIEKEINNKVEREKRITEIIENIKNLRQPSLIGIHFDENEFSDISDLIFFLLIVHKENKQEVDELISYAAMLRTRRKRYTFTEYESFKRNYYVHTRN